MTPERLEALRASLRRQNAMPDADLELVAQPHDMEALFRLARVGLAVEADAFKRRVVKAETLQESLIRLAKSYETPRTVKLSKGDV